MPKYVYRGPSDMLIVEDKAYPRIAHDEKVGPGESFEMSELDMINMATSSGGHRFELLSDISNDMKVSSRQESERLRIAKRRNDARMIPATTRDLDSEIVAVPSVARGTEGPSTPAAGPVAQP